MQDETRPWAQDYGVDEALAVCSWCGQTALCVTEDESRVRTCARCWDEPNPREPVAHEVLHLFTPIATLRGQMGLGT
jgi:hypothetical protein